MTFSYRAFVPTLQKMKESINRLSLISLRIDPMKFYRLIDGLSFLSPQMSDKENENGNEGERGVVTKTRPKTKKPSMYRVLLMNDDYTPMEFVVSMLISIFNKGQEEAMQITLNVHQNGIGVCGVYTFEIAETKVAQVMDAAKRSQHPLQCTLEKA